MFVWRYDAADKTLLVLVGADGKDFITAVVLVERVAAAEVVELRNVLTERVTEVLGKALVGPLKDVGTFLTLVLVAAEMLVMTVVYERTKYLPVVVKLAPALTDNMPLTVVAITVVYLEFRLDIKDVLGG